MTSPVPAREPLTDSRGFVTRIWERFFNGLSGTGGTIINQYVDIDLTEQITGTDSSVESRLVKEGKKSEDASTTGGNRDMDRLVKYMEKLVEEARSVARSTDVSRREVERMLEEIRSTPAGKNHDVSKLVGEMNQHGSRLREVEKKINSIDKMVAMEV